MKDELFLQKDIKQADDELDCYGYCLNNGINHFMNTEFGRAAAYHENIARSLRELDRMKKNKQNVDQMQHLLDRIRQEERIQLRSLL